MKQKMIAIIMVPVVLLAVFVAWKSYSSNLSPSQAGPLRQATTEGGPRAAGGGGGPTPAQMMDTMAKELTLSDPQKTQIAAIQEDLAAKRKALPKDMSREDRRAQMTKNRAEADTKIKALLSADQAKKYDEMQAKRRAQMQAMRQQGGGPGGGGRGPGSGGPGGGMMAGSAGGPAGGTTTAPATADPKK
jgi:Spy/CpxP family protein refolding chaperone